MPIRSNDAVEVDDGKVSNELSRSSKADMRQAPSGSIRNAMEIALELQRRLAQPELERETLTVSSVQPKSQFPTSLALFPGSDACSAPTRDGVQPRSGCCWVET